MTTPKLDTDEDVLAWVRNHQPEIRAFEPSASKEARHAREHETAAYIAECVRHREAYEQFAGFTADKHPSSAARQAENERLRQAFDALGYEPGAPCDWANYDSTKHEHDIARLAAAIKGPGPVEGNK